jgi:ABC-type multidrug transport system fused ATPase/permease subunit
MEQVLSAVERAGCSDIIDRLHDGLDTKVGERGCRLSGGERKRIALARALIRPISILLLDEATSELDSSIEEKILNVIDTLANDMIIINVSHRPSAIRHSDRVLVVNSGKIIELSPQDAELFLNSNKAHMCS